MGSLNAEQKMLRDRLTAWMRYFFALYVHEDKTKVQFAKRLHLEGPTVTNILNGKRTAGIDVLVHMRDYLHADIVQMLDTSPPRRPDELEPIPRHASRQTAATEKQGRA